jgi:hypothetical protein
MRLSDVLGEKDLRAVLEEMEQPTTARPPKEKGADAIKVTGYFVHGHWRRHWYPTKKRLRLVTVNGRKKPVAAAP